MVPSSLPAGVARDEYDKLSVDKKLMAQLRVGSTQAVKQLLDDGALVDGSPEIQQLQCRPLFTAAAYGRVDLVKLLVERGAGLELSHLNDDTWENDHLLLGAGSRALHAAAFCGQVEAVRLLVGLGADPNAVDNHGRTVLMAACMWHTHSEDRLDLVRELLKGGANAALADKAGVLALHAAARQGHTDVCALLLSAAPTTISVGTSGRASALYYATVSGHEKTVAFLLSAGVNDNVAWLEKGRSPLIMAIREGHETIVRMFLDERGIDAVGGLSVIPLAMCTALIWKAMRIFLMLLNVEGEEKQKHWANAAIEKQSVLHWATRYRSFAALHMLFSAGADINADINADKLISCARSDHEEEDEDKEYATQAALQRLFERAPACRARSWAWPSGALTAVGVTSDMVVWCKQAVAAPLGVSIFRPEEGRLWLFSRRFARYSEK